MKASVASRLTVRQREFVDLHVVQGYSIYRAYALAFDLPESRHLQSRGSQLLRKPHIAHYVAELQKDIADKATDDKFLSLEEKRAFLARVVRTPVGDIHENHDLAQEVQFKREGTVVKMPSKLQAIELDAKIAGELREKLDVEVSPRMVELAEHLE